MLETSHRDFQRHFKTSRKDDYAVTPGEDDYILRRSSAIDENGDTDNAAAAAAVAVAVAGNNGHKLAGLRCKEKYGGPEDEYAEKEMAFWSDIPSDASYKSPFMDETERFLTFEP